METSLATRFKASLSSATSSPSSSSSSLSSLERLLLFASSVASSSFGEGSGDDDKYLKDTEFIEAFKVELDLILRGLPTIWLDEILVPVKSTSTRVTDELNDDNNNNCKSPKTLSITGKAQSLYQAHRAIANFLGPCNEVRFSALSWTQQVSKSLLDAMIATFDAKKDYTFTAIVLQDLPREALISFLKEVANHFASSIDSLSSKSSVMLFRSFIEDSLAPSWCYESIAILIPHVSKTLDLSSKSPCLLIVLQTIVKVALKDYEVHSLVQLIFLKSFHHHRSGNYNYEAFIEMSLSLFPRKEDCMMVLQILATYYSDVHFVNNGSASVHRMISKALLHGMEMLNLSSSSPEDMGTLLSISKAVSVNLDGANEQKRKDCLQVAVRVAKAYGQEISFDELNPAKNDSNEGHTEDNCQVDSGDEDDSDEEFQTYLEDSRPTHQNRVYYLGDCLKMLQKACTNQHDGSEDVYEGYQEMLESIPLIIETDPDDGREICSPLIIELLRAPKPPSVPHYEDLRDLAVLSCLSTYPMVAIPVVVSFIESESSTVGDKIVGLNLLSRTAEDIMKSKIAGSDEENGVKGKSAAAAKTSMNKEFTEVPSTQTAKTIIKRPHKLQQLKKASKVVIYKSRLEIIRLIFFPVRNILAKQLGSAVDDVKLIAATDSVRSSKEYKTATDQFDGIDALVPTQAFLTIAVMCRISINTNLQRQVYSETMQLCLVYKLSLSSSLRTAVMVALGSAMESWSHMKSRKSSSFGSNAGSGLIGQVADIEVQDDTLAMSVADFASHAIKKESNQASRDALSCILRCAIETFEVPNNVVH